MTPQNPSQDLWPTIQRSASHAFAPFQREFSRFLDELIATWPPAVLRALPTMDLQDTAEALEVAVDLPSLSAEDVKVELDGDQLTITGHKNSAAKTDTAAFRTQERSRDASSRSVYLPSSVDASRVSARMSHGVLCITAPKRGDAPTKIIQIVGD